MIKHIEKGEIFVTAFSFTGENQCRLCVPVRIAGGFEARCSCSDGGWTIGGEMGISPYVTVS